MNKILVVTHRNEEGLYIEIDNIQIKDSIVAINFIGEWSISYISNMLKSLDIPRKYNITYINSKALASILEYSDNSIKATKSCSS